MSGAVNADGQLLVAPEAAAPPPPNLTLPATFTPQGAIYGVTAAQAAVTLQALKPAFLVIHGADGSIYFARQLAPGEAYRAANLAGKRRVPATTLPPRLDFGELPRDPGVYLFRDDRGRVLYVGKSVSIRSRARAHFAPYTPPAAWTAHATVVDYRTTGSELGALVLENRLIKQLKPPGNKRLARRDDRLVYIRCRLDIPFPILDVAPDPAAGHAVTIGPVRGRSLALELVEQLDSLFGLRHCGRRLPRDISHAWKPSSADATGLSSLITAAKAACPTCSRSPKPRCTTNSRPSPKCFLPPTPRVTPNYTKRCSAKCSAIIRPPTGSGSNAPSNCWNCIRTIRRPSANWLKSTRIRSIRTAAPWTV